MGEILGLGVTHFPGLAPRAIGPRSLKRALQDPGLPEQYRTPEGWPEPMRREWGNDEGASTGQRHREAIAVEMRKARKALDDFAPDFLVVWGDDQYENFKEDVVPAFCILAYDSMEVKPWAVETAPNFWDEPQDKSFLIKGNREAAKYLARGLLDENFDVAYAYQPLHKNLGHAFSNTVLYLDWDRQGFDYPIIPISVNCYGRGLTGMHGYMASLANPLAEADYDPPSPSPARCFDLGAACARVLSDSPWRVALVASSSWSHAFLTAKHYYLYPDIPADQRLYKALTEADYAAWRSTSLAAVEDSGQHEMLNWFCLIGAMAELKRAPANTVFIESHIMNSNKVIALFPPSMGEAARSS